MPHQRQLLQPSQPKLFRQKLHKTHPMWRPKAPQRRLNRGNPPVAQRRPRAPSPLGPPPPRLPRSRPRPNRLINKWLHHPPTPNSSNQTLAPRPPLPQRHQRTHLLRRILPSSLTLQMLQMLLRNLSKKHHQQ